METASREPLPRAMVVSTEDPSGITDPIITNKGRSKATNTAQRLVMVWVSGGSGFRGNLVQDSAC